MYTFDAPEFTAGESTPLANRRANVNPDVFTTFTAAPGPMQITSVASFLPNTLFSGQFLVVPQGVTTLTLSFTIPVEAVSMDFALNGQAPGFLPQIGYGTVITDTPAINIGGGEGFWGGSAAVAFANPVPSVTVAAFSPPGNQVEFAIDNLVVTIPAPGAAGLMGLAALLATRRRRA
jgi:hypothetical protein